MREQTSFDYEIDDDSQLFYNNNNYVSKCNLQSHDEKASNILQANISIVYMYDHLENNFHCSINYQE